MKPTLFAAVGALFSLLGTWAVGFNFDHRGPEWIPVLLFCVLFGVAGFFIGKAVSK